MSECMDFSKARIVPCECGGYMGKPCGQVFIDGIDMRSNGRFERPVAEKIVTLLKGDDLADAVERLLEVGADEGRYAKGSPMDKAWKQVRKVMRDRGRNV